MKLLVILVIWVLAESACAEILPFDLSASGNIPVRVAVTKTGKNEHGKTQKTFEVSLNRSEYVSSDISLEFFIVVERNGKERAVLVEAKPVSKLPVTLDILWQARFSDTKLVGWVVRVLRDGKIVGVSSDNEVHKTWAQDPSVLEMFLADQEHLK